jgi:hypothetical protein
MRPSPAVDLRPRREDRGGSAGGARRVSLEQSPHRRVASASPGPRSSALRPPRNSPHPRGRPLDSAGRSGHRRGRDDDSCTDQ